MEVRWGAWRRWGLSAGAACIALLAPAAATARTPPPVVGMGDQKAAMFSDPRFAELGLRRARLVVSWDVVSNPQELAQVDAWLGAAQLAHVTPLVAFGHDWAEAKRRVLPGPKTYRKAFLRFRARYPWVREYTPWNEANHCSQPTCHRPERAADYYRVVRRACTSCTVVAADVLDQPNMVSWLRAFRRAVPRTMSTTIWGLHNYLDANRLRSTGTRRMLGAVKGQVWFTETGGIVRRRHYRNKITFVESAAHAATATRWILKLAAAHPRVRRIYLYQWNANSSKQVWDSGLIGPRGNARPAFNVLARAINVSRSVRTRP